MGDEDPFGMGAPPLDEPATDGMFGDAPPLAAPEGLDGMGGGGDSFQDASEALPTFGESTGGDMGGMGGMGGGLGNEFAAPMEMGPVAQWRIENNEKVEAKATAAAAEVSKKIAEAQTALSQFYSERAEKTTKRAASNRDAEAQYVKDRDASMMADSWQSVCKLVDLKEKAGQEVDTSRMRSLLIQLKN